MAREKPEEDSSSLKDNGTIISIELRGAAGDTAKITLNGGSSFFVPWDLIASEDLYHGKELSEQGAERLKQAAERHKAYNQALRYLSLREHSRFELKAKLKNKGFCPEDLEEILNSLEKEGLLSDERYAKNYLASRLRKNSESYFLLFSRLLQKGVSRQKAEEALAEVYTPVEEELALDRLYEKYTVKGLPAEGELLNKFLAKGFSYSRIREFLRGKREPE